MRAFFLTTSGPRKVQVAKRCPFCGRETEPGPSRGLLTCNPCNELAEWFPPDLSYSLTGESGTGRSVWLYNIADYYIHSAPRRIRCVYVSIDDAPARIREQAAPYIRNIAEVEKQENLAFVDVHSAIAGVKSRERYSVTDAADVEELTDHLASLAGQGYGAFFLDSLTSLAALMNPSDLERGILKLLARLKSHDAAVFLTSEPSLGGPVAVRPWRYSDAHVEFRYSTSFDTENLVPMGLMTWLRGTPGPMREGNPLREFRFRKARGKATYSDWIPFAIGSDGVLLVLPDDPAAIQRIKDTVHSVQRLSKLA